MCKIVFSVTFNVSCWCSKEPSHRKDSFEHQKCLSENIIVDLRIISKLTSKPNIKIKALRVLMGTAVFKRSSLQIGRFLV